MVNAHSQKLLSYEKDTPPTWMNFTDKMNKRNCTLNGTYSDFIYLKFWEKQINHARSQGSSYFRGWGTDWKESVETLVLCVLIGSWSRGSEHQADTYISKLIKSNL